MKYMLQNSNDVKLRTEKMYEEVLNKHTTFHRMEIFLSFINKLAPICESMNHHPEINWIYNKIELTLSTHDAGDKITELDYQLANKIDEIPKFLNII